MTPDSPEMEQICQLSRRYGIDILFGYVEREGEQLYSSCALVQEGALAYNYRRISKGWKDYDKTDERYREGEGVEGFSYHGQTVTVTLCGDMWVYPERFVTEGLLLWPIYVNFPENGWAEDYAEQAALPFDREGCLIVEL